MLTQSLHRRLTALCTAAYFTSYLSRLNLAVVMVELIRCGFAPRETAALGTIVSLALAPRWSTFRKSSPTI